MKILSLSIFSLFLFACGSQEVQQTTLESPTTTISAGDQKVSAAKTFTEISNVSTPLDFVQFVPCAAGGSGEDVHLFGKIHTIIRTTINGNKVGIKTQSNAQKVSGAGLTTGDKYHGTGVTQETSNEGTDGLPETETFINNFRIIGQGRGNNFLVHENAHITINAKGIATVSVDNFSIECK